MEGFRMNSHQLDNEEIVSRMVASLKPLCDEWVQFGQTRKLAYLKAGIPASDIKRFDAVARDREVLRRLVMGVNGKEQAA
jgi:hypothetical protein